jgi:hypothetical protein
MARSRNIKPGFFSNDVLAELEPLTRLLFIGLWIIADRAGRLEDRPKRIKAEVMPYDDCDVDDMLGSLSRAGFIQRYESGGVKAIQIVNWDKHQNPHVKEAESTVPAPDKSGASTRPARKPEQPKPERAGLIPDSGFLIPDSIALTGFEEFWSAWPKSDRKQAKGECLKAWKKARAEPDAALIVSHVERMKLTESWRKGFIPAPLVYLNQRRWEGADGTANDNDPYGLRQAVNAVNA